MRSLPRLNELKSASDACRCAHSAAAAASLAGASLRVFQLQGECAALPQQPAVLLSFSVPEPLVGHADGVLEAFAAAAGAVVGAAAGGAWTRVALTSMEQASHAVVL